MNAHIFECVHGVLVFPAFFGFQSCGRTRNNLCHRHLYNPSKSIESSIWNEKCPKSDRKMIGKWPKSDRKVIEKWPKSDRKVTEKWRKSDEKAERIWTCKYYINLYFRGVQLRNYLIRNNNVNHVVSNKITLFTEN